jgi:hypothetical protein
MKLSRIAIAFTTLLAATAVAHADLSARNNGRQNGERGALRSANRVADVLLIGETGTWSSSDINPDLILSESARNPIPVLRDPQEPVSASALLFYTLGSIGAWQLGRSAGRKHVLASLDWCHSSAPNVGDMTPLTGGFAAALAPASPITAPLRVAPLRIAAECRPILIEAPDVTAPRGPPF